MGKPATLWIRNLPLSVVHYHRKRDNEDLKFILNLNNYRNAHMRVLHASKVAYHEVVKELIPPEGIGLFLGKKFATEYHYWHGRNGRLDCQNAVAIIDKYTLDALGEHGVIDDDSYKEHPFSHGWTFEGVDKENPRCDLRLTEIR